MDLTSLLTTIKTTVSNNSFAQGGLIIGIVGGVVAWLRNLPTRLYEFAKERIILSIEFNSSDNLFHFFTMFLNQHQSIDSKTNLKVTTSEYYAYGNPQVASNGNDTTILKPKITYSFGDGNYFIKHKGMYILVSRAKESPGGEKKLDFNMKETFTLKVMRWNRAKMKDMVEEIYGMFVQKTADKLKIYRAQWENWALNSMQPKRKVESVILSGTVMEDLIKDIEKFLSEEEYYANMGTPWQRTYLLYGPPGTGKTSAILALASHFNRGVAPLSPASATSDEQLISLMSEVPENAFLVIEDIDAAFDGRKPANEKIAITFSGLINAINGVQSSYGRIMFMTTNHIEKLDEALIRDGRVDLKFYLGNATSKQKRGLFQKFYGNSDLLDAYMAVVDTKEISPAKLQGTFLKNKDNPLAALQELEKIS